MSDLDLVFSTLDDLEAPVSWPEVARREPHRLPPEPGPAKRLLVAAVALAVAAAGIGLAFRALSTGGARPAAAGNGLIAFELWRSNDRQTDISISVVDPGTGAVSDLLASDAAHLSSTHPAWSRDGSQLAFARQDAVDGSDRWGLWVMNADGSGLRPLYLEEPEGGIGSGRPSFAIDQIAWSPEGERVAFIRVDRSSSDGGEWIQRLYVIGTDGSGLTALTDPDLQVQQISWSPDGTDIALAGQTVGYERADPHLFVMGADGTGLTPLDQAGSYPEWSPDGTRIAFAGHQPGEEHSDIFVMKANGKGRTQLTDTPGPEWGPVWSPDGREIAFLAQGLAAGQDCRLALMSEDGSSVRTVVQGSDIGGCLFHAAWQPVPPDGARPTEEPSPSVSGTEPIETRVAATIPVGAFLRGVAVGEGAVWASVDNANGGPGDHLLVRIDPVTNEVVSSVPLPEAGDLAVGEGSVWVVSRAASEGAILRIDPTTNEIAANHPGR